MRRKMRTVSVFAMTFLVWAACSAQSKQQERQFEIVGRNGDSVTVKAHLFYSYSVNSSQEIYDGILLVQGSGTTKLQWNRVKHIEIADGQSAKVEIEAEITLVDGKTLPAKLRFGNLMGHTTLGEFNTSLGDIHTITPLPRKT